jgi:hypothetical protein
MHATVRRYEGPLRRERHPMRAITTSASLRKDDSSLGATLNPVALPSGDVSWAAASPRPGQDTLHRQTDGHF